MSIRSTQAIVQGALREALPVEAQAMDRNGRLDADGTSIRIEGHYRHTCG